MVFKKITKVYFEPYKEMNQLHLNSHEGGLNIGSSFHERMSQGNDVSDSS